MDKFFDIIKKLRVPAREGKVSRQAAIDALMMEAGVSEDIAAKAADNLFTKEDKIPFRPTPSLNPILPPSAKPSGSNFSFKNLFNKGLLKDNP